MREFETEAEAAQHAREFDLPMCQCYPDETRYVVGTEVEIRHAGWVGAIVPPPEGPRNQLQVQILDLLAKQAKDSIVSYSDVAEVLQCSRVFVADTARRWQSLWLQ
jgi:hypothetical protein